MLTCYSSAFALEWLREAIFQRTFLGYSWGYSRFAFAQISLPSPAQNWREGLNAYLYSYA
ncbi:MAG: hypothetical protein KDK40_05175 [Chlamydiia bacterium]|nr:hypothetical protein [Chlamydiia bacterium]